jgi:hypothetical protein
MDINTEFSIALNIIDRKIAHLNIELTRNYSEKIREELDKYLKLKKEIDEGNKEIIRKIINEEEQ